MPDHLHFCLLFTGPGGSSTGGAAFEKEDSKFGFIALVGLDDAISSPQSTPAPHQSELASAG